MINHKQIKTRHLAASACVVILLTYVQPNLARVDTTYSSINQKNELPKLATSFSTYAPVARPKIGSNSQLPTYDIIGWPTDGGGHLNMDRQLIKMLTSSKVGSSSSRSSASNDTSDFQRNLANLKKVVQGKKSASNFSLSQASVKQQRAINSTRQQQSMGSLEDDINTIHVLMAMLMLANKRLVEQREKQQLTTAKPSPNRGNSKRSSVQRHQKSLAVAGNKLELESASHVSKTMAALGHTGYDANYTNRHSHHHHHKKHQSHGSTTATKPSVFKHLPSRKGLQSSALSSKLSTGESRAYQLDHSLVRPGYSMSDPALAGHHQEANRRHHPHQNPLHNHQPMTARDLLQVERPTLQDEHMTPENMFVSRPRHPLLDYLQRQGVQSPTSEVGPPTFNTGHPFHRHQHPQQPELEQEQPASGVTSAPHVGGSPIAAPMVPPYNSWSLLHPSQRHHQQLSLGSHGFNQELGAGGNEPLDPLQKMLAAAKSQQAAALDYERRRLDHELEIRRQQEEAKRQHEARQTTSRPPVQATPVGGQESQGSHGVNNESAGGSPEEPQNDGNQLEEPPAGGQENKQQQEGGDEQGSSGNQQEAKEAQRQAEDDPDMKQLQGFAGDDFTDLFPPGILSDADIKEMRRDQEEQRERQAQEEQREREAEEAKGEEEEQQQAEVENSNSNSNSDSEEQQQQQIEAGGNSTSHATQDANSQSLEPSEGRNSSRSGLEQQKVTRYLPTNLLLAANDSMRANKTRRSHADELRVMMQLGLPDRSASHRAYLGERPSTAGGHDELGASISLEDYLAVTGNGVGLEAPVVAGAAPSATVDEHMATGAEYVEGGASQSPQEPMETLASSSSSTVAKLRR